MITNQAIVKVERANVYGLGATLKLNVFTKLKLLSKINYTSGKDHEGEPLRHVVSFFWYY